MKDCLLIFPHNLFEKIYLPKKDNYTIYLIEESLFFGDKERITNFSKLKLILHRASMKYYYDYLIKNNYKVIYIEYKKVQKYNFIKNYNTVMIYELADHLLYSRLCKIIKKNKQDLIVIDSPLFLLTLNDIEKYSKTKKNNNTFFHKHFYDWQLKKLDIPYITKSYDKENRKSIPKNINIPKVNNKNKNNKYVKEAITYINKNFKNNYGNTENFIFPITHKESKQWLNNFLKNKLHSFGDYQDAILENEPFLFHSLLAPMINIGLLTPDKVLKITIEYYKKNKKKIKINNFEGFIRQVIGWREYMRMLYQLDYHNLIKSNYFNNKKKLNKKWYEGTLDIKPVDDTIKKAFNNGYLHHIERLMVMLNFMNLCRINPHDIYKWFMEFSCDSYDWVMIGNVYGMGYFSTKTMKKPYLSSSNYIRQMSDYKNDDNWNIIWDSLFYKFLVDNKTKLKGGSAIYLRNLTHYNKKSTKDKKEIINIAKKFI
jgi:deoxyribodipyrimidine photolyase-related protein